jgi:hypothetical protein
LVGLIDALVFVTLGPRFRGDERLIVWRTLSPFVPAEAHMR